MQEFVDKLWEQIISASKDKKSILFWGFNETAIELVNRMDKHGLSNQISGIIDSRTEIEGRKVGNFQVLTPDSLPELKLDILVITSDSDKEQIVRMFSKLDNRKPKIVMAGTGHLEFNDPFFRKLLSSLSVPSRAFGYKNMLIHIYQSLLYLANNGIDGNIAEFGVYKGGTTVFLAKTIKHFGINAKIFAFDTFDGFPNKKSVLDMYDDPHDEFFDFNAVSNHCKPYNIELVRGDISETYHRLEGVPLILSFFDTDNFSPTNSALDLCYQQTVKGGILAFDHYFCDERWIQTLGERIAVSEFFADKNILNLYGTGIFIKL